MKTNIDKDCEQLKGEFEGEVFYNCTFKDLNGLTLKNCDLNKSKFLTDKMEDVLNFTVTMNCHSFVDVEISEFLFDMIILLLARTKGNTEKRKKLIEVLGGKERVKQLLRNMEDWEP